MKLQGQHGYAMAALLVGMSIMAVLMTAAMPVWRQITQREREAELVFRGEQYARAISLYQKRMGPGTMPPSLDVLVEQKFLRKRYKDPITGEDFDLVRQVTGLQPGAPGEGRGGPAGPPAGSAGFGTSSGTSPGAGGATTLGGIVGVASKSKASSIRVYNGRTHYNEWQFVSVMQTQAAGAGAGGAGGAGGGRGQQGQPPGGGFGSGGAGGGRDGGRGGRGGGPQNGNPFGRGGGSAGGGGGQSPFQRTPPD